MSHNTVEDSSRNRNDKESDRFIAAIRGLRFSMNFLGLWPRSCSWDPYNVVWYVHSFGLAFMWFGVAAGLIVHIDDTDAIIDSLSLLIPMTFFCLKWISFSLQKSTMEQLLYTMDKDWTSLEEITSTGQGGSKSERIMTGYSRFPRNFFFTTVILLTGGVAFYVRDSLSSRNSSNKFLPMPHSWYPVDYDRGYNFELLVAAQAVTSFTLSLSGISIDSFFVTATLHLCGQFRILRYCIEGIKYDIIRPEYCEARVKFMVRRHQVLLGVAEIIQKAYNHIILIQLTTATLTVCFLGYAFVAEIEKDRVRPMVLLKTGCAFGDMLLLIFSYCIVGDILTNQSAAITVAVYNAEWYYCTKPINMSLVLVMIRAGKPLRLTGAKLLPMSLESFMVILKLAVSYLSVLRAVNEKEC